MTRLKLPDDDADIVQIARFAARYNAHERWAQTPDHLNSMVAPIILERDSSGRIPEWAGVDALRALLFYEYRADYHRGGSTEGERNMRQVVEAIRSKTGAAVT